VLGGVVTSIDYAATAADPTVVSRVLNQASRAVMRASTLVNGLLAFSEEGPRPDDLADLTELLNELAYDMEAAINGRNIKFEMDVSDLPVVPVPRTQLTTILRNIMQNAIEAMPDGGVLGVKANTTDDSVNIVISDTGRGLDETARSRMFEPFWTTKGDPSQRGTSTAGLGLAIAYGLVHVIGGSISVESEPDKGSTFTVSVPIPEWPKETPST
jgi:signal transduction histidine kinase